MKKYIEFINENMDEYIRQMKIQKRIDAIRKGETTRDVNDHEWGNLVGWDLPSFEEYCDDNDYDTDDNAWQNYVWYCDDAYQDIKNDR